MNGSPGDRRSRTLALGLLLFVLIAAVAVLATPLVLLHRHYDRELESLNDRLTSYRRMAASQAQLERSLEAVRALDIRRHYLKSAAPGLAAGEIQELEKSVIEANGGRLVSMQIQAHRDEGDFRRIAVNAQVLGSIGTIQGILRTLETGEPFVFVDNLNLRSLSPGAARNAPAPEFELVAQFDLIGYASIAKQ